MSRHSAKKEILSALKRVREKHPKIITLSTDEINRVVKSHEIYSAYEANDNFLYPVILTALFFLGSTPWLIHQVYEYSQLLAFYIINNLPTKDYFLDNEYVSVACFFLFIAIPFYLLMFSTTLGQKLMRLSSKSSEFRNLYFDKKTVKFWIFTGILVMIWLLIPITYTSAFNYLPKQYIHTIWVTYLMLPSPVVVVFPTLFLTLTISLIFSSLIKKSNKNHNLINETIACRSLLLLDYIEINNDTSTLNSTHRGHLAIKIKDIANLIRSLGEALNKDHPVDRFAKNRFEQAADSVLSLKLAVTLPETKSIKLLKIRLVSLTNIFLSGNLRDLPTVNYETFKNIEISKRISIFKTTISLVGLGLFLAFPLLVWSLLIHLMQPKIDESLKPLLPILYSIWCIVGVLSTAERFAPDARAMITDTIKLLLSRK